MKTLELKIPPVVTMIVVAMVMILLAQVFPEFTLTFSLKKELSIVIVIAGILVAMSGVWAFHNARTTLNPLLPSDTKSIVSYGIFKVSRNPMYLGFLISLIGLAVYLLNIIAFVSIFVFKIFMDELHIKPEEKVLQKKFGKAYSDYLDKVPRWI